MSSQIRGLFWLQLISIVVEEKVFVETNRSN